MATLYLMGLTSIVTFSSALQHSDYSARALKMDHHIPEQTMAICMSGFARTVVDSDVQNGFNSHVRKSKYARGLSSEVPDLFMYVRIGDTTSPSNDVNRDDVTNESFVQTAINVLNPTLSKIDRSSGPYQSPSRKQLGVDPTCFDHGFFAKNGGYNLPRAMNFFEGWYVCHEMIEQHEGSFGLHYDLVLFTRPDLVWTRDIPMPWFSPEVAYIGIDWWQILPRKISKGVAHTLQANFLTKDELCCGVGCSEGILFCRVDHICDAHDITCFVVGRETLGTQIKRKDGRLVAPGAAYHMWGDETPTRIEDWGESHHYLQYFQDTDAKYKAVADVLCQQCHGQ